MEKIKVLLVDDDLDFGNTAVLLLKKQAMKCTFKTHCLEWKALS